VVTDATTALVVDPAAGETTWPGVGQVGRRW